MPDTVHPQAAAARQSTPRPARSLFWEILKWLVVPVVVIVPLSLGATYWIGISLATDAFDRALASQTKALAEQVEWSRRLGRYVLTTNLATILPDDETDTHLYRIEDTSGKLLFGDGELEKAPREDITEVGAVFFRDEKLGNLKVRTAILMRTIAETDEPIFVQIAETLDKRTQLAREMTRNVLLPEIFLIVSLVLLVWIGLRRGLLPLDRLRRELAARNPTDVRPVDTTLAPREVAPLVDAFNQMLARVAQNNEAQKRFIANAAHQLRTPLAGVKVQTELALQSHDPDAMAEALQRIAKGSARSTYLINQLLTLARAEAGAGGPIAMAPFDFAALVRATVEEFWDRAREREIDLGAEVETLRVMLTGSAPLMREMLANLIDNALKYSPPQSHVTVRLKEGKGEIVLEVEDAGIGIAPAERALVFERFYRSTHAEHDLGDTGTGIGLAIVKEIVGRHGGEVVVLEPTSGRGTLMRARFPLKK
jgi:two-component system, OmpR family, sensor histidine kinase TctE